MRHLVRNQALSANCTYSIITVMKYWVTNRHYRVDTNILTEMGKFALTIDSSSTVKKLADDLALTTAERVWLHLFSQNFIGLILTHYSSSPHEYHHCRRIRQPHLESFNLPIQETSLLVLRCWKETDILTFFRAIVSPIFNLGQGTTISTLLITPIPRSSIG